MKTHSMINRPKTCEVLQQSLQLDPHSFESFGSFAIKLKEEWLTANTQSNNAALVLMTGITPTPAGEGKTTTGIALTDALQKFRRTTLCLRQASLGPFFGVKGGASGGGLADLAYSDKTNLHFTGDFHAISSAHNFVSALIDNHLFHGNLLDIDPDKILWKRTIDMNDRGLRRTKIGLGNANGIERSEEFVIVAASEMMATLCLAQDPADLNHRLNRIGVAFSKKGSLIRLGDLQANEALRLLLEDAIRPNVTLTRAGSPCFVHGGPFANIAHGCNSIRATQAALSLSEIVVTEAGFGSDLGAEKFLNIKAPHLGKKPNVAVLVTSIRALKFHGGQAKAELQVPNLKTLEAGIKNLDSHIHLIQNIYGIPCVVALNAFASDSEEEFTLLEKHLREKNVEFARCHGYERGAEGAMALAEKVLGLLEKPIKLEADPIYSVRDSFISKLEKLATKVHGARTIQLSDQAKIDLKQFGSLLDELPICLAKTPFSFTSEPKRGGLPQSHDLPIDRIHPAFGAGFAVVTTGDIMLMPGLPKEPRGTQLNSK